MPEISYTLFIDGEAAASNLLEAVQEIEVEDHAELADMMRLRLAGSVDESGSHWTFLDDDLFSRLTPLALTVKVGSTTTETLFDGFVIETKAEFANEPGASTLEIIAMDGTVLMNLEEKIRAWPDMSDSDIAETIFGEYGFTTNVEATQPVRQEIDYLTTQRGTDIQFLRYLARRNGYEAYVEINPSSGETEGHFHPPQLDQPPQGVLSYARPEKKAPGRPDNQHQPEIRKGPQLLQQAVAGRNRFRHGQSGRLRSSAVGSGNAPARRPLDPVTHDRLPTGPR